MEVRDYFPLFQRPTFMQPVFTARTAFFSALTRYPTIIIGGHILSTPLLKLGGLSRVTGVKESQVLRWLDRGTGGIESSRFDSTTSGAGDHRHFSLPTINKVGIASKLMLLNISAGQALADAARYTDFGDGNRAPNELFEFGRTVIVHTATGTTIKNLDADSSLADAFGRPMTPAIILDIGPVIDEINTKLKEETKRK
jgi:hypothetical protein